MSLWCRAHGIVVATDSPPTHVRAPWQKAPRSQPKAPTCSTAACLSVLRSRYVEETNTCSFFFAAIVRPPFERELSAFVGEGLNSTIREAVIGSSQDRAALAKKIRALERRILLAEELIRFLKKHPAVASRTLMWNLRHKPGLYVYHKAFIRPIWTKGRVALRLERYMDPSNDVQAYNGVEVGLRGYLRAVTRELGAVLKKVKVNLRSAKDLL